MNRVFIFDSRDRVVKLSEDLRALLGLPLERVGSLEWQGIVVEDSSRFKPEPGAAPARRSGYLKRENGEVVEASLTCERLQGARDLYWVEVAVPEGAAASGGESTRDQGSLEFLTTVSHELRVALNGVIGFASVLGKTKLDVGQQELLEKLVSCNHMLKGLINDILEYSRVASSKVDLRVEAVALASFVREVVGLFRERAEKKGLELSVECAASAERQVSLSKLRVSQVLSNLIANAIKFTEMGGARVFVECDDDWIRINVQDTGPGISECDVDSVFRPFVQAGARSGETEGSGLGLAISKELVERMGGSLSLRHPAEGGSRFEIKLPLVSSLPMGEEESLSVPANSGALRREPPSRDGEKTKRVLIVEDNQLNADILGHFLQDYGVRFDHVENGRMAVEKYDEGGYDLILMDVMLPEMNGYEATEKILSRSTRQPPVPIVGVTAKVFRRDQLRCLEAGMVEVVHKPVDFKQLRDVLDLYLYSNGYERASLAESPAADPVEASRTADKAPSDNATSGFDAGALEDYIDRMRSSDESRREVVDAAIGILDNEVERLLESIEANDLKEVGMRAHSLKGALALLGARDLLDLVKGLELLAVEPGGELRREHWKFLIRDVYGAFRETLDGYMDSTRGSESAKR